MKFKKYVICLLATILFILFNQCSKDASTDPDPESRHEILIETNRAFELFNIAIAIMPSIQYDDNYVDRTTTYYQDVVSRFRPFRSHEFIQDLQNYLETIDPTLNNLKEISLLSEFDGDSIDLSDEAYDTYVPPAMAPFMNHIVTAANAFIADTDFHEFIDVHQEEYQTRISAFEKNVDVERMWNWLEDHFSSRYEMYYIPLSPLTGGSHFAERGEIAGKNTAVMVVSGPTSMSLNDVEAGDYERILFTEIDHNYVNPVSNLYLEQIVDAIDNLNDWNESYDYWSRYLTFNEYMTWGVFSLYAKEFYSPSVYQTVINAMITQMVEYRGFIRFEAFHNNLLNLYENLPKSKEIEDLYPDILAWMQAYSD